MRKTPSKAQKALAKSRKLTVNDVVRRKVARYSTVARVLLKGSVFTFIAPTIDGKNNFTGERILNLKSGASNSIKKGGELDDVMRLARLKWFVYIAVMYIDGKGDKAMEAAVVSCNKPHTRMALDKILNTNHVALIEDVGAENVVNVGWIACPNGVEITDEYAYDLFIKMDTWNSKVNVSI
jgi:hypothetical protein